VGLSSKVLFLKHVFSSFFFFMIILFGGSDLLSVKQFVKVNDTVFAVTSLTGLGFANTEWNLTIAWYVCFQVYDTVPREDRMLFYQLFAAELIVAK